MKVVDNITKLGKVNLPCALTIGVFDGVHIGHQYLLKKLIQKNRYSSVFTFANHPKEVIEKKAPSPLLSTLDERLKKLELIGIDLVIVEQFTPKLASLSAEAFLLYIREYLPFTDLILGEGALLGKNREGTPVVLRAISQKFHFSLEYLPKLSYEGEEVSSSHIRKLLQAKEIHKAHTLLKHCKK
jgi:riboflavin kinase / FMN adenylyltransferase